MVRSFILFNVLSFMLSAPGVAQTVDYAQDCEDAETQVELNTCSGKSYAKADSLLNAVYNRIISRLEPPRVEQLRQAERLWIRYRDKHCKAAVWPSRKGSIAPLERNRCAERLTRQRIRELRTVYEE